MVAPVAPWPRLRRLRPSGPGQRRASAEGRLGRDPRRFGPRGSGARFGLGGRATCRTPYVGWAHGRADRHPMEELAFENLRRPAMILALEGWADAACSSTDAVEYLLDTYPQDPLEPIDNEEYYDYSATRPILHQDAEDSGIEWPQICFHLVHHPQRDLVIVHGKEPQLRWRSVLDELLDRITDVDPQLVIVLSSALSDVPHTRDTVIESYSGSALVLDALQGTKPLDYNGPATLLSILGRALDFMRIPSVQMHAGATEAERSPARDRF